MVSLPPQLPKDPISTVRLAVNHVNANVEKALSSLTLPPLDAIPDIGDGTAKAGSWVRYTAMIQDIWDTELFVLSSPDGHSGLLSEHAAASDHPDAKLAERLPIYLVSLPGETPWVRALRSSASTPLVSSFSHPTPPSNSKNKRSRDDDADMSDSPMGDMINRVASPAVPVVPSAPVAPTAPTGSGKRSKPCDSQRAPMATSMGLNSPVHNQLGASAVVAKLYDVATGRNVRINTLVEVVGILQDGLDVAPPTEEDAADSFAAEIAARNPRNVKRLHVVKWREVRDWEANPLTRPLGVSGMNAAKKEVVGIVGEMRQTIINYFASALCGDMLAAEYLFMCLLSRPVRTDGAGVLAKLSLNIVIPNESSGDVAAGIIHAIQGVLASVVEVNVNIAGLNSVEIFPKKDYGLNRLKAGALQLAAGSCLIGNESALSNGQLAERGVRNVRALTAVAQRCVTPVDFQYYESEVGVECSSVFISKGGKSIIPTDIIVKVKPDSGCRVKKWNEYGEDVLKKIRLAVILLAEDGTFDISEEASKGVEKAYVEARRKGQAKDGQECLQKWLTVARCSARSFGEDLLTGSRWQHALAMERRREERT